MVKNTCLCLRISSSFVGNTPSLQTHSLSKDRGKCNKNGMDDSGTRRFSPSYYADIINVSVVLCCGGAGPVPPSDASALKARGLGVEVIAGRGPEENSSSAKFE